MADEVDRGLEAVKVAVCVPWRGGEETREQNWDFVRPWIKSLGWPVYLGDREGPWSRAAACNAAARDAGDWDVALFADADTIGEKDAIEAAIALAVETDGGVRPHEHLWSLTRSETRRVMELGLHTCHPRRQFLGGGLLVVSRTAWDTIGGYDEAFSGWGHEDSHTNTRLLVKAQWNRVPGNAWHLFHRRDPTDTPARRANQERMWAIQQQHRDAIERASQTKGYDVGAIL